MHQTEQIVRMFRSGRGRHGKARKGKRAMVNGSGLWQRGLHESMAELGKTGRRESWWAWGLGIVIIVRKASIIRDRHQAVLM